MMQELITKSIMTIVSFIITGSLGYFVAKVREYKSELQKKDEQQEIVKEAMMTMLQNNLTNTYFVYEQLEEIPDYVYKNWLNLLKVYEKLGGDDYIHILEDKMSKWKIKATDILGK